MRNVFVYGILKQNDPALRAKVHNYRLIDMGWFPAAIPADGHTVIGELLEVTDSEVQDFDRIEGHPNFYERTPVEVELQNGETLEAEMYVINSDYHRADSFPTPSLDINDTEYEYHCR